MFVLGPGRYICSILFAVELGWICVLRTCCFDPFWRVLMCSEYAIDVEILLDLFGSCKLQGKLFRCTSSFSRAQEWCNTWVDHRIWLADDSSIIPSLHHFVLRVAWYAGHMASNHSVFGPATRRSDYSLRLEEDSLAQCLDLNHCQA